MSKSELINSDSEYENNRTEESETLDDEYLPDLTTKLQLLCEPYVSNEALKESCPGKKSSDFEDDRSSIANTLWCSCGKCKSKATHAESICCLDKKKLLKVILKLHFHSFWKHFYPVVCW